MKLKLNFTFYLSISDIDNYSMDNVFLLFSLLKQWHEFDSYFCLKHL